MSTAMKIPRHIAIIMDGNGRWAQSKGWLRTRGHQEGAKRVDEITTACVELGVKHLTLYAFSTENWLRPKTEVSLLMRLLVQHLKTMDKKLIKNGVSLAAKGSLDKLPERVQQELQRVIQKTHLETPKMTLTLCLSYGAREEITEAVRNIAKSVASGQIEPHQITEALVSSNLYQPGVPDPDLLIRTGGEYRVSNFLLWQIAYSEFYVTPVYWPEFKPSEVTKAVEEFNRRERRFGKTGQQIKGASPTHPGPEQHQ